MVIKNFTSFLNNYDFYNSLLESTEREDDYLLKYSISDEEKEKFFIMGKDGEVIEETTETTESRVPPYAECYFFKNNLQIDVENFVAEILEILKNYAPEVQFSSTIYTIEDIPEDVLISETKDEEENRLLFISIRQKKNSISISGMEDTEFHRGLISQIGNYIQTSLGI